MLFVAEAIFFSIKFILSFSIVASVLRFLLQVEFFVDALFLLIGLNLYKLY